MNKNILAILAVVGFVGFIGVLDASNRALLNFLAYFLYLGYLRIKPDELFWVYVGQAAIITVLSTFLLMSGWLAMFYLLDSDVGVLVNGFWIGYWSLHIVFNVSLRIFEYKERFST